MATISSFNGAVPTASLPANASLLEWELSTPDEGMMRAVWASWAVLAVPATGMVCVIIAAALKKRSGLNLYMAAMVLPDAMANIFMIVTCAMAYSQGQYPGASFCHLQCFFLSMQIFVSSWTNLFIGVEVYRILSSTRTLAQYEQPSGRTVGLVCFGVYAFCGLCAGLQSINAVPVSPKALRGLVCFPASNNGLFISILITVGPGVLLPAALTNHLMVSAWRTGLVNWDLIFPKKLVRAMTPHTSNAKDSSLEKALGKEAYRRGRAQGRSVTLFFLRVMTTLIFWLVAAMLALFSHAVWSVFVCVFIGAHSSHLTPRARPRAPCPLLRARHRAAPALQVFYRLSTVFLTPMADHSAQRTSGAFADVVTLPIALRVTIRLLLTRCRLLANVHCAARLLL